VTTTSPVVWRPDRDRVERANVTRLARAAGTDGHAALLDWSRAEPEAFWEAVVGDLHNRPAGDLSSLANSHALAGLGKDPK
jgi:hypothetical protein